MKVFLLKDVAKIGMAHEMVNVADGYANNYLIPRKLAVEVRPGNEAGFKKRQRHLEKRKEVIETQSSMLAERIKALKLKLRKKVHDDDKLYGAIAPAEVVELLADKGIPVSKNQVIFNKSIKKVGDHKVTIKLSSRLQPTFTLTIVGTVE